MTDGKSPGNDGLIIEFLETSWSELKKTIFNMCFTLFW